MSKALIIAFASLASAVLGLVLWIAGSMAIWFIQHGKEQQTSGLVAVAGGYEAFIAPTLIAFACGMLGARIALKIYNRQTRQLSS